MGGDTQTTALWSVRNAHRRFYLPGKVLHLPPHNIPALLSLTSRLNSFTLLPFNPSTSLASPSHPFPLSSHWLITQTHFPPSPLPLHHQSRFSHELSFEGWEMTQLPLSFTNNITPIFPSSPFPLFPF